MSVTIGRDIVTAAGPDQGEQPRVAIVGGGLAGIAAALDCAGGGAHVTLLEARPRLGGAAYSVHRNGLHVDNGQHVFLRCCTEYRELLGRIGALGGVTLQPRLEIPVLWGGSGEPVWLRRRALPAPAHLAPALAGAGFLGVRQRLAALPAMLALDRVDPDAPENDARPFGQWLAEHRQSPAAIERLWELIARPTLNLTAADASLAQAAQVFQTGLLRDPGAGDIGWARVPLSELHDVAARRALARAGVEVHSSVRVESVTPDGGELRVKAGGRPTIHADAVIVAVQHDRVARLVPALDALGSSLEQLGTSPIVNLHVVYDRPVLEVPFAAAVGSPVQWVFDRTAGAGLGSGQYLAVSLSAADRESQMTVEELRERFVPALAELLPAARAAQVERFFVMREHAATFRAAPGARARRPGPRTSIPGLILAGAYTDTGWPATMEGAVRSGRAAAHEALAAAAVAFAVNGVGAR